MFPGLFQPWVSGPEAIERWKRWPTPPEFVRGGWLCSQGCFNPGSRDQRRLNAASVGQLLRSSYVVGGYVPRVDNPWVLGPEAIERCKRWPTPSEFVRGGWLCSQG